MKKTMFLLAILVVAFGIQGCKKETQDTGAPAESTATDSGSAEKPADSGAAADSGKVGVPECDEYITKMKKCIDGKIPDAAKATVKQSFDQTTKAWRDSAATPGGKSALATGCKAALDAAKQSMTAYGCEF